MINVIPCPETLLKNNIPKQVKMKRDNFLVMLTLFTFCCETHAFYYPEMCNLEKNVNDCSFQFSRTNTCYVYEGEDCKSYDFSSWNLKPLYSSISEMDAKFSVSVVPYVLYQYGISLSAVNVTFKSSNRAIKGFSLRMTQGTREACRLFDFRKSDSITKPFTLYFDCLNELVEKGWKQVSIVFKAYPINSELNYLVYIPSKPKENITSPCHWKPLVMIFKGGLPKYEVYIKFSNAPANLRIRFFNVTLVDSFGSATHNIIPTSMESDMISSKFDVVADGYYAVIVGLVSDEESCPVSETDIFYVGKKIKDYSLMLFIVLIVVMIMCAPLLIYFSCRWYIKNASPTSSCTLLFVYSYKRLHHEFLVMYSRYLDSQYGLKVNMIYEKRGNPKTWLEEKYSQSDVIVFVISPSLKTLDQGSKGEGEHHWVDQLTEAKALIDDSYIGRKKICKICFPYCGKEHVPKCLEKHGPLFMLPGDLDKFLCFVFSCPRQLYILSKLFSQNHHKVLKPSIKLDNDEAIKEKLQVVMKTSSRDSLILKVENTTESSLQTKTENLKSDDMTKQVTFPISEYLLKKSEDKKLDFPSQETSFKETDSDDFMIYCARKILYSG